MRKFIEALHQLVHGRPDLLTEEERQRLRSIVLMMVCGRQRQRPKP